MRSQAAFKGHPLHPMLVAFPIAFLYGSLGFDLAGRLGGWAGGSASGAYLSVAALVSGLVAAVPGLIDYLSVVPPASSGKSWATWHMAVNTSVLAAFALGCVFRDWNSLVPGVGTLLLEAAGVALVTWGGWMGGTLVYRDQIGVDHRYAHAGKWHEQTVEGRPGQSVVVAKADELKAGQMKLLHVGDRRLVLARTEAGYVVCDDRCTHRGGSLAGGVLAGETVCCPWHGSQFDVRTGAVKAGPAERAIGTYRVEEADGEVRLTLPAAGS